MERFNNVLVSILCAGMIITSITPVSADKAFAASLKLSNKSVTISVGKTKTIKVKKAAKNTKITWSVTKKSKIAKITRKVSKGKKAKAVVKGIKPGKAVLKATYKIGKKRKTLKCTINVTAPVVTEAPIATQASKPTEAAQTVKPTDAPAVKPTEAPIVAPTEEPILKPTDAPTVKPTLVPTDAPTATQAVKPTATPTVKPTHEPVVTREPSEFEGSSLTLADADTMPVVYIDSNGDDYDGVSLIAKAFAGDMKLVCGKEPEIKTSTGNVDAELAIVAGSIGENAFIDKLITDKKLDVSAIKDKRECFMIKFIDNTIVIVGSDKRGTEYGIFHISELMGVSPWVYWADVVPEVKSEITIDVNDLDYTSKEPSVRYRGIFLNDEDPSLTTWTRNKFGGRNELFYDHVYELIIRLKGNYLWPAMWGDSFSTDGKSEPIANAKLADAYGVVMGASHHEPMCRQGEEWGRVWKNYVPASMQSRGSKALWDYTVAPDSLEKFWEDGIKRNGKFENIVTIGMRGEADSSLGLSATNYAALLKKIITSQKNILKNNGLEDKPTLLAVYKEVESAWYEGGLQDWKEGLKDTIIMLCEDNNSNLRTLPTKEYVNDYGGWGMYYHFDYVGSPRSYMWLDTVQMEKVYDQMSQAYISGVDDAWIVNVGDLKPMEASISYFLDMAYDMDTWGKEGSCEGYVRHWMDQQFGYAFDDKMLDDSTKLLNEYLSLGTSRHAENLFSNTYHTENYSEAKDWLIRCDKIINLAEETYAKVPENLKAAFFELVYYPAKAVANINRMQIYAGLNKKYKAQKSMLANTFAKLCEDAIALDKSLMVDYNKNLPVVGNKWDGMMTDPISNGKSCPHTSYTGWDRYTGSYPTVSTVAGVEEAKLIVGVDGSSSAVSTGSINLPEFTSTNKEVYTIEVQNGGQTTFDFTATANNDFIVLSAKTGSVRTARDIEVSIDWSKVSASATGTVTINGAGKTVTVNVPVKVTDITGLEDNTYVMENNYVVFDLDNYVASKQGSNGETMSYVPGYGKFGETIKVSPYDASFTQSQLGNAPYVEYSVYVPADGSYSVTGYFQPTSNLTKSKVELKYAIAVDGGNPTVKNTLTSGYVGGSAGSWGNDVMNNCRTAVTNHTLSKGTHKIRYYQLDPNAELMKLVVHKGSLLSSYNGPKESYYVGKNVDVEARIADKVAYSAHIDNYAVEFPAPGTSTVAFDADLDLSKVIIGDTSNNKGGYDSAQKAFVVTGDSAMGNGYYFDLPRTVEVGDGVDVTIEGSYSGSENGFRAWLGNGVNAKSEVAAINVSGTFTQTVTIYARDEACTRLTLKAKSGSKITGLKVTKIHVKSHVD